MAVTIRAKRGTRAQLNAAASANNIVEGELYLITDEQRMAVGISPTSYQTFVIGSTRVYVGAGTPENPTDGDVWIQPA